ncbi:MAG: divergent polysaccharide deacetylase family protein [bacterium]|nr:divergent polysaccharide deacetylase family protein [bacterium]MDD5757246.1 divergent polysaccharide deacetylase family protein [bacterium]
MKKKAKAFLRALIILSILGLGVYYVYLTYINPPVVDYDGISNKVDQAIDQVLVSYGASNLNIIKVFKEEKELGKITWIQTTKEIRLAETIDLKEAGKALEEVIEDQGARVISLTLDPAESILNLKAGVKNIVMEILVLRRKSAAPKYRAAIIIDDLGYDLKVATQLMSLHEPLTFAVLPGERYSKAIAEQVTKAGYEVFLHQPMEPLGYPKDNPGKRAILLTMTATEVKAMLLKNISDVPFANGVNNHMGSKLTENGPKMQEIMNILKEQKLLFVDSRTSAKSVAYQTAKKIGLKTAYNQVFLDNENDLDYIKKQLDLVAKIAMKNGQVVAIGHCQRKETILALQEKLPEFRKLGIAIVPVSQLVE